MKTFKEIHKEVLIEQYPNLSEKETKDINDNDTFVTKVVVTIISLVVLFWGVHMLLGG